MSIRVKQKGEGRPVYIFEPDWARPGGNLYGENFLTDIAGGTISDRGLSIINSGTIWEVSSVETDPDFLFYLWKRGKGEEFYMYVSYEEILFLYSFYKLNGFEMMIDEIENSYKKQKNKNCNLF